MHENVISKSGEYRGTIPNMVDYERERASFTWDAARRALDGLPGGRGLNIAHEAVVRHAGRAGRIRSGEGAGVDARRRGHCSTVRRGNALGGPPRE